MSKISKKSFIFLFELYNLYNISSIKSKQVEYFLARWFENRNYGRLVKNVDFK